MRFWTVAVIISIIHNTVWCTDFDKETIPQDSSIVSIQNEEPEVKTILIGNVTELSYGYSCPRPGDMWGDSVNRFTNPYIHSAALTQYFIINNFVFSAGLEYSITASDFSVDYSWDSLYTSQLPAYDTVGIHYYITDGDSVPEYVINQYYISRIDTAEKEITYNSVVKIHCLTIPVDIGYRWRFEKFALYAKLGARFNFITRTTGKVFLADNREWVQFDEKIEKDFYYSTSASFAFEYPFSALCSFIVEPEYRYSWHSRVNKDFSKNYHLFGMKFGIQFWL